jgi:hypothetical protein
LLDDVHRYPPRQAGTDKRIRDRPFSAVPCFLQVFVRIEIPSTLNQYTLAAPLYFNGHRTTQSGNRRATQWNKARAGGRFAQPGKELTFNVLVVGFGKKIKADRKRIADPVSGLRAVTLASGPHARRAAPPWDIPELAPVSTTSVL